jgi:hypothetical protein
MLTHKLLNDSISHLQDIISDKQLLVILTQILSDENYAENDINLDYDLVYEALRYAHKVELHYFEHSKELNQYIKKSRPDSVIMILESQYSIVDDMEHIFQWRDALDVSFLDSSVYAVKQNLNAKSQATVIFGYGTNEGSKIIVNNQDYEGMM